jgi:polysaccharide deacetylase family protein (PEP-CTERM system associated)
MHASTDGVTLTIDVEELEHSDGARRIEAITDELLQFLDERDVRATAFVVGTLAAERPALVRRIADGNHEIGLHGYEHRVLASSDRETFTSRCRDARNRLGDLTGQQVGGFRAPLFSLTPATPWAPQAITDSGFRYSSSVVPTRHPRTHSGYGGAPRGPFRWECGLVEMPCPVVGRVPVGGAYLRLLPAVVIDRMVRSIRGSAPWLYVHPYDFDVEEPFTVLPDTSWLESRLLFARRKVMFARVDRALRLGSAPTLGERVQALVDEALPTFSPSGEDQSVR